MEETQGNGSKKKRAGQGTKGSTKELVA